MSHKKAKPELEESGPGSDSDQSSSSSDIPSSSSDEQSDGVPVIEQAPRKNGHRKTHRPDDTLSSAAAGVSGSNLINKANTLASKSDVEADIAIRLGWEILGFRALKARRVRLFFLKVYSVFSKLDSCLRCLRCLGTS